MSPGSSIHSSVGSKSLSMLRSRSGKRLFSVREASMGLVLICQRRFPKPCSKKTSYLFTLRRKSESKKKRNGKKLIQGSEMFIQNVRGIYHCDTPLKARKSRHLTASGFSCLSQNEDPCQKSHTSQISNFTLTLGLGKKNPKMFQCFGIYRSR